MQFRADIEGFRAVAIGVILLFHAGLTALPGGFVGVDVFFVISGFLITSLLTRDIEAKTFGFRHFYLRRLRRLGPALLATVLATLVAGAFLLGPDYYFDLGASALAAILSLSNVHFWLETDYFGGAAKYEPLLHMWSLAVEEQFYLVWPAVLLVLMRVLPKSLLLPAFAVLGLASLLVAEIFLSRDASAAFYLPQFRVFEFMLGAAVALLPPLSARMAPVSHVLSLAGGAAIVAACLTLDEASRFPGLAALLPSLGAAAMIWAGPRGVVNRGLAVAPLRFVGRISYSVYLVHWPIIVFYTVVERQPASGAEILALTFASLVVGYALYRFVETPYRGTSAAGQPVSDRALLKHAGLAALACILIIAPIRGTIGLPQRLSGENLALFERLEDQKRDRDRLIAHGGCRVGWQKSTFISAEDFDSRCLPQDGSFVLILGNSHASDIYSGLKTLYPDAAIVNFAAHGCTLYASNERPHCEVAAQFQRELVTRHSARISLVIYHESGHALTRGIRSATEATDMFDRGLAELTTLAHSVERFVLVGPRPHHAGTIEAKIRPFASVAGLESGAPLEDYRALDASLQQAVSDAGLDYRPLLDIACPSDCPVFLSDGLPVLIDGSHLSPEAAIDHVERFMRENPDLDRILGDDLGT